MLDEGVDRRGKARGRQGAGHTQQDGLVPVVAIGQLEIEKAPLNRRQRDGAFDRALLRTAGDRAARQRGQRGERRRLEELLRRQMEAGLVRARNDLDAQDGIAAELEEVVVRADVGDAEHPGPDLRKRQFVRGGGREELRPRVRAARHIRGGKRPSVDFAVRGDRQRIQRHEDRRHHVFRQDGPEECAQLADRRRRDPAEVK